MNPFVRFRSVCPFVAICCAAAVASAEAPQQVRAFLKAYCSECHTAEAAEGDFQLDLLRQIKSEADAEYWQLALDNLRLGEMPPEAAKQPELRRLEQVTEWIEGELKRSAEHLKGLSGEVVLRRLNRFEYENTMEDLFGVRGDFAEAFPADATEDGFDNVGSALTLSAEQIDQYLQAAAWVIDRSIVTKPRPKTELKKLTLADFNRKYEEAEQKRREYEKKNPPTETERQRKEAAREKGNYGRHYYPDHGDDYLIPMKYMKPGTRDHFRVREPGWYRFQFTGYTARNPNELPLRLRVEYGSFRQGTVAKVAGVAQFSSTEPIENEYRVYLQPNEQIQLVMLDGPNWMWGSRIAENQEPVVAIGGIEIEGPLIDVWPPRGHQTLMGKRDPKTLSDEGAKQAIGELASRLFRRPVDNSVAGEFVGFYQAARKQLVALDAFKLTAKAMMASPHFVYHVEPQSNGRHEVDPYALANRLSFFLWRSVPDDELYGLAAAGKLSDPAVLTSQVERLLADDRSERMLTDFVGQWLGIKLVGDMQPDGKLYPEYDAELERAMIAETEGFIREILHNDLSLTNLIDSDWAMLNDRLAAHYGIPSVQGNHFRRVPLDKQTTVRGGLLSQASILNITSNGTVTSPVVRGVWVLERLLGTSPSPPPPDVPAIEPDIRGTSTIQQQLEKHRSIAQCNSCHRKIDPYGIALENFDVIGAWRENYRALEPTANPNRPKIVDGQAVVASDRLPKAGGFDGFVEFRKLLLQREDLVLENMAEKLATYALGRSMTIADRVVLRDIAAKTKASGGGMKIMIHHLVESDIFQQP